MTQQSPIVQDLNNKIMELRRLYGSLLTKSHENDKLLDALRN